MGLIDNIYAGFNNFKRRKAIDILTSSDPDKIVEYGEKSLIRSFRNAANRVPAYRRLLAAEKVRVDQVCDVPSFKAHVPIVTKEIIFTENDISELCVEGTFQTMRSTMTSSGFSGLFAFGISSEQNRKETIFGLDTTLDYTFQTSRKKTLFINSLPMGVMIPTNLPVANTSARSDMALAIFKKFRKDFDQFLFISDPHFLKKILEDGLDQGIDWKKANVHLITGDDWVPETFRAYLGDILGTDWDNCDRAFIGGTMGICELGLSLFHESVHSVRIQRLAYENRELRYALYGEGVDILPTLFHYYPHKTFIEVAGEGEGPGDLVISMLGDSLLIPMFRYNVKDNASIIPYKRLVKVLSDFGYAHMAPDLKLPLVAIFGRTGRCITVNSGSVNPEQIKEGMYSDYAVAGSTTGHFKLSRENDAVLVEVQLKKGITPAPPLEESFRRALLKFVTAESRVKLYPYQDYPHQMEIDYERKFKNMD